MTTFLMTTTELIRKDDAPIVTHVTQDGYIVDENGEVLGHVQDGKDSPFVADTEDRVAWVLDKLGAAEGELAGIEAQEKAVFENFAAMKSKARKKVAWIEMRFRPDLQWFAAKMLADQKVKTWTCAYGKLSFRKTPGSISILAKEDALEWCKSHAPEAIKIAESVLVTPLKGRENELPAGVFEVKPSGESFSISTGVKSEGK